MEIKVDGKTMRRKTKSYLGINLPTSRLVACLAVVAALLTVSCVAGAAVAPGQPPAAPQSAGSSGGLEAILATKVLDVGKQRIAFLLVGPDALITVPEVRVTSAFLGEGGPVGETTTARFHPWPYGVRGTYVTEMTFDRPGRWELAIVVDHQGVPGAVRAGVEVAQKGTVPSLGSLPPLSRTKTLRSAGALEKLTTDFTPDPELYQLSIEEAVASGLPTVVVFASPAFCTSPTCGPQTDTLSELKEGYRGRANFIHVEIYDNPDQIQGDLSRGMLAQAVHDWGLSAITGWLNESWTFVLSREGIVSQRFEGFATLEELEISLKLALGPV